MRTVFVLLAEGCIGNLQLMEEPTEAQAMDGPIAPMSCSEAPIEIFPRPSIEFEQAYVQMPKNGGAEYVITTSDIKIGGDIVSEFYDLVNNCDYEQTVIVEFSHDEGEAVIDQYRSGWFTLDYNEGVDSGAAGGGGDDGEGGYTEFISSFRTTLQPYESMTRTVTYTVFRASEQEDPAMMTFDYTVVHADVLDEAEDTTSRSFHTEIGLKASVYNMFAGWQEPDGGADTGTDTGLEGDTGSAPAPL